MPRPNGGYFDHLEEMRSSLTGLQRVKKGLEGSLQNPNMDSSTRAFLEKSLQKTTHYIQRINDIGIK